MEESDWKIRIPPVWEAQFSINTEYLKEAASKYAEIWQLDETTFVAGKGHRKSVQQRHYEKLKEYLLKLNVMKIKSAA